MRRPIRSTEWPIGRLGRLPVSLWRPGSSPVLAQALQEHPAERRPIAHRTLTRRPLNLARDPAHQVDPRRRQTSQHASRHQKSFPVVTVHGAHHIGCLPYWPPMETTNLTVSSWYGDGMYASSRRISFNLCAFSASAGKSTSKDWVASCPGSSRSVPYVWNLRAG